MPLCAPNFGHFTGHQKLVRGRILGEYIKAILRGLGKNLALTPHISHIKGAKALKKFFPKASEGDVF